MKAWDINISLHNQLIDYAEQLFQQKKYSKLITIVEELARIEAKYYIGYLASVRMEYLLLETGKQLFEQRTYPTKSTAERRVLHIATEFYNVGGHTRVVLDWVKNDVNSHSKILLLNQNSEFDLSTNIPIHQLKEEDSIDRARALRNFLAHNYFDVIVLHQHMEDAVPTLALWDIKTASNSLVLFYNHANFRFSLGNIIAHKRVNFNRGDMAISERYRYPVEECFLPFILGEKIAVPLSNKAIRTERKKLGLAYKKVLLTIGSSYKYTKFKEQNFFQEWNAFLMKHPEYVFVVIGSTIVDFNNNCPDSKLASNFKLMGRVINPIIYYQLSDYVIDAYPLPTGLGTLEATYYGAVPILAYGEGALVMGKETRKLYPDAILDRLTYSDEKSYFEFVLEELETGKYKEAAKPILETYIQSWMLLEGWQRQLEAIYTNPVIEKIVPSERKDVLNTSVASKNWYEYASNSPRSFDLMELCFRMNLPFSWKLFKQYISLIAQSSKIRGSRLKIFVTYCFGKYKHFHK